MAITINGTSGISGVDGSASSPAIQGTDTNTGISFPAADTVAVNTGGSERVRCDSSGRVGIGTTSPAARMHLSETGSAGSYLEMLRIQNTATEAAGVAAGIRFLGASNWLGGIQARFQDGSGNTSLLFETASGGSISERARIDSSGRLLVGTSSTSSSATLLLQGYSGTTGPGIARLCTTSATPTNGEDLGYVAFGDSSHTFSGAWINAQRDGGTWSGSSKPSRLVFSTTADGASSPTGRLAIRQDGAIGFYSSSTFGCLYSGVSAGAGTSVPTFIGRHSSTDTGSGTESFKVWSNGNVVNINNSYGSLSDIKLKENIVDATSQWDDLKALQVRKYNFKEGQTHTQIGLVAQEVELVSPGLVTESPDRDAEGNDLGTVTKSVNYSVLYMKAVKALQEAMERIEQLEAKVAALESA